MTLDELGLDRNLLKSTATATNTIDPSTVSDTNSDTTTGTNLTASLANSPITPTGASSGLAGNVLTGTVITACIFKSTDQSNRIEISNNDMALYDSSIGGGGTVTGDSSSISFFKSTDISRGFIMDSRAGKNNNNEVVWELYSLPNSGYSNYIYIGREGKDPNSSYTNYIEIDPNIDTSRIYSSDNGAFNVVLTKNHIAPSEPHISVFDARFYGLNGIVSAITGSGPDGFAGFGWQGIDMWADSSVINQGKNMVPQTPSTYNIGTPFNRYDTIYSDHFGDAIAKSIFYGTFLACPLPTVENALEIIEKIPEPTKVGNRGHYGNGLYFDDLTFPEEVLYELEGKKEIEHSHMIGFLMKAIIELNQKVKILEANL